MIIDDTGGITVKNATIELGNASDTTLARVSAGVASIEGVRIITDASTTSGKILKNNGTTFVASTETYAAPGTSGNVMTSDGTNWTSAAPAGGGGWTLVYNGTFSGATTATIDNNGTNLAGNTDEIYMIVIRAVQSTADRLLLRFNNATTNYLSNLTGHNQAGTDTDSSGATDSGVRVTATVTGGKQHFITATCYAKTTPIKMMVFNSVSTDGTNITNASGGGHWNDTSTAVTSFTIASSGGVNFGSGSEYWLYKKS